jgi:Animal haem peroxidase
MRRVHGSRPRGLKDITQSPLFEGRFGRMFRRLPTFVLTEDQIATLADRMRSEAGTSTDNPNIPAGYTYFGQFIDHDITFDPASSLERLNDPDALVNFRTPRFDLDSLYGRGPLDEPYLYDDNSFGRFLIGKGRKVDSGQETAEDDLQRNLQGTALIGDPRNDENVIVSQLHLGFVKFHNRVLEQVIAERGLAGPVAFSEAQRIVRWHYQWVVVHDYLHRTVGEQVLNEILIPRDPNQPNDLPQIETRFYKPRNQPYLPVEFSVAAFRFGHSQVRGNYKINDVVPELPVFAQSEEPGPLEDFHGGRHLPEAWTLDWSFFFDTAGPGSSKQKTLAIDTKLADGLFKLPGAPTELESLASRNLTRGWRFSLPSGRRVARAMLETPLSRDELGLDHPPPLWFYILKEAEVREGGMRLGRVGGRLVAEVLLGLLKGDPLAYVNVDPDWKPFDPDERPTIPDVDGDGRLTLVDILAFAGVLTIPPPPPGGWGG